MPSRFDAVVRARAGGLSGPRRRFLIVCEGGKTEPNYFNAFKDGLRVRGAAVVQVFGTGMNTRSLVAFAEAKKRELESESGLTFFETWVVFDRDSFGASQFDNAIHSAEAKGFKCAWSNEAFELWYVLHFEDRQTTMTRGDYPSCLRRHLGRKYEKTCQDMYRLLEAFPGAQAEATKRASRLLARCKKEGAAPSGSNPCTTVYQLVQRLNEYLP